ncbi:MAG: hypothetical protein ACI9D0_001128 [Bacteroidia bacterium]|jgi:hypothetical protein
MKEIMNALRVVPVLLLLTACQSDEYEIATEAGIGVESVAGPYGRNLFAKTASSPKAHLAPFWGTDADSLSVHMTFTWESDAPNVGLEWAVGYDTPLNPKGYDWELIPESLATTFIPQEIVPIRGTDSILIWGFDRRGNTILEKWTWTAPVVTDASVTKGALTRKQDLGMFSGEGIVDLRVFYDLSHGEPLEGACEAVTAVLKMRGSSEVISIDLRVSNPALHLLASDSIGAEYVVPALSNTAFLGGIGINHMHLGQIFVLKAEWDTAVPFVIVSDVDRDGVPDGVFSMAHDDGILFSVWGEYDPENPLRLSYFPYG